MTDVFSRCSFYSGELKDLFLQNALLRHNIYIGLGTATKAVSSQIQITKQMSRQGV